MVYLKTKSTYRGEKEKKSSKSHQYDSKQDLLAELNTAITINRLRHKFEFLLKKDGIRPESSRELEDTHQNYRHLSFDKFPEVQIGSPFSPFRNNKTYHQRENFSHSSQNPEHCEHNAEHGEHNAEHQDLPGVLHANIVEPTDEPTETDQVQTTASLDLSKTFELHSQADARHTIFLDFDGHTTTDYAWVAHASGNNIVNEAFDIDGDHSTFSATELTRIQYIWQRVAEDFSPFNVNVTTEDPGVEALRYSGSSDTHWGIRAVIGEGTWRRSAGGVAFLNSFTSSHDRPVFIFTNNLVNGKEKSTAEAISHEVGHSLGLSHKGTASTSYYTGHGSGSTGWAPILGVGYYKELTQWSQGEYSNASNTDDDLSIITGQNGFTFRTDDHSNTLSLATAVKQNIDSFFGQGIIEQRTDSDIFSFTIESGQLILEVKPAKRGANLDILANLYNSSNELIVSSNPENSLNAIFDTTLIAGTYYLEITGTGKGDPISGGYSDYGSLGQYSFTGHITPQTPETSISLTNGILKIEDINGENTNDYLTLSNVGSRLKVEDSVGNYISSSSELFIDNSTIEVVQNNISNYILIQSHEGDDVIDASEISKRIVAHGAEGVDTIIGGKENDIIRGGDGADFLDGGEGVDYLDYRDSQDPVLIDLASGTASAGYAQGDSFTNFENVYASSHNDSITGDENRNYLLGFAGNDSLNGLAGNDVLYGHAGVDTISGGEGRDIIRGGDGADVLDGGEGIDYLDYRDSKDAVLIDLASGTASAGYAQGDSFTNFENVYASSHNDSITGDENRNYLLGFAGNDSLNGLAGNDVLYGHAGVDTISGGEGRDIIRGGDGADVLDGGEGIDYLDYRDSKDAVLIDLTLGTAAAGYAQGDSFTNFENVYASSHNDSITGDENRNYLLGFAGNDSLNGLAGNDVLFGYAGVDTISGGDGKDIIRGGDGADVLDGGEGIDYLDYRDSKDAVLIDLASGTAAAGYAQGDSFTNFENVYASSHNDSITGDENRNYLLGFAGNDSLNGLAGNDVLFGFSGVDIISGGEGRDIIRGGDGADVLDGGEGIDSLDYRDSTEAVLIDLAVGTAAAGYAQGDSFTNFENVYASYHNDSITGDNNRNYLLGFSGNDSLNGLAGNDILRGGKGADILTGGAGNDRIDYRFLSESRLDSVDLIKEFDIGEDAIDSSYAVISADIFHGGEVASFEQASIQSVLSETSFLSNGAATFHVGTQHYIAINDAIAGFNAETDLVAEITGFKGSLSELKII